jgi:transcriptional regulator with XRE-family HTH domain
MDADRRGFHACRAPSKREVAVSTAQTTPFGNALRHWRRLRSVSQLDLAGSAATTTRHLSYLETGRSRPSREMVDRLADALVIPLRERNRLLEQAGLPAAYPEGELAADDLAAFRRVLDRLLSTHEPYPAFVIDRHWNLVAANAATHRVFPHQPGTNTVRLLIDSLRPLVENWEDVAPALVERIAADLMRYPDDQQLRELHEYAIAALPPHARSRSPQPSRVMCPRFRLDGTVVRTITVAARFESAVDITLDELRVELIYPEDADSDRFFHEQAGHPRDGG